MFKLNNLLILTISLLATAGCNNQRNNGLSAQNSCDTAARSIDPTAFTLTKKQLEVFAPVDPEDFPDEEALIVKSIVSTFTIELENEEKALVRLSNSNVQGSSGFQAVCTYNISLDSQATRIVEMPTSNINGKIQLQKFKIEIGNPTKEDLSDFLRVTPVEEDKTVDESSDDEEGTPDVAPPVPFSTYFSAEGDQVAYYNLKENPKKKRTAEENLKQDFYIHYNNDTNRVKSRITVTRVIKKK